MLKGAKIKLLKVKVIIFLSAKPILLDKEISVKIINKKK